MGYGLDRQRPIPVYCGRREWQTDYQIVPLGPTNWGNLSKNLALWRSPVQMMSRQRNPTQEFSYTEFKQAAGSRKHRSGAFDGKHPDTSPVTRWTPRLPGLPVANSEALKTGLENANVPITASKAAHWSRHRGSSLDRHSGTLVLPAPPGSGRRHFSGSAPSENPRPSCGGAAKVTFPMLPSRRGQSEELPGIRVPERPSKVHPACSPSTQRCPFGGPSGYRKTLLAKAVTATQASLLLDVGL